MTPIFEQTHWPSPAKLNLFLYITGKNAQGYHNLQTLFQFVEHGDKLDIQANETGKITLAPAIDGLEIEDNLIYRAAIALKQRAQTPLGAHIHLFKTLPMGGGIGGGSSNAATTLVALNFLWGLNLSNSELQEIGVELGADVPVFIKGVAAFAEGVGEKLTPVKPNEKTYLVVRPNVHISTAEIFSHNDLPRNTPQRPWTELNQAPYENDCEKIVRSLYPEVDKQLSWLLQYAPSRLTGTGSCVFSEFDDSAQATEVQKNVTKDCQSFVTKGVNLSPLNVTLAKYQQAYT
jgi:4-diphosphocytidyl-2-C-methyl-D-erythritol kinase